jgi:hypothetical protein
MEWIPDARAADSDLLLVAPSAGHCLPGAWLGSFRSVTAVDLDPLARILFRRLHGASLNRTRLDWITGDVFRQWPTLLAANPGHTILFCNFLGQAVECDEKKARAWFATLPATLSGRQWASFHDRYSGELTTKSAPPLDSQNRAEATTLLAHFYDRSIGGELTEHELPPIFPQHRPYRYWNWPLSPDQFHIIEGCRS